MSERRRGRPPLVLIVLGCMAVLVGAAAAASARSGGSAVAAGVGVQQRRPPDRSTDGAVPGQLLVDLRSGTSATTVRALWHAVGARTIGGSPVPDVRLVQVDSSRTAAAIRTLEASAPVMWAEPNRRVIAREVGVDGRTMLPLTTRFGDQWELQNTGQSVAPYFAGTGADVGADIDAPRAWAITQGSHSVRIGLVDTGVDPGQPDLAGNLDLAAGADLIRPGAQPVSQVADHGTHVAGVIGAVGSTLQQHTVSGVDWNATMVPFRVLDDTGVGTDATIAAGLERAGAEGLPIVNVSLGSNVYSRAQALAIGRHPGTLYVVSADEGFWAGNGVGRSSDDIPDYPCDLPLANVICVGASDNHDAIAPFSDWGAASVDLFAPGVGILSTLPTAQLRTDFAVTPFTGQAGSWTIGHATGSRAPTWRWAQQGTFQDVESGDHAHAYARGTDSWIQSPAFSLVGASGCSVTLDSYAGLAVGDSLTIDASADGFAHTFTVGGVTGPTNGLVRQQAGLTFALRSFAGDPSVAVRLRLRGAHGGGYGVDVDDVTVHCLTGGSYSQSDGFMSGTSMAAPAVSGTLGLLRSAYPAASGPFLKAALLGGVHVTAAFTGKAVSNGRVDAAGALDAAAALAATGHPIAFQTVGPAADDSVAASRPTFSWTQSGAAKGLSGYRLIVDGAQSGPVIDPRAVSLDGLFHRTGSVLASGFHSWSVQAVDAAGAVTSTPVITFTVAARTGIAFQRITGARAGACAADSGPERACAIRGDLRLVVSVDEPRFANGLPVVIAAYRLTGPAGVRASVPTQRTSEPVSGGPGVARATLGSSLRLAPGTYVVTASLAGTAASPSVSVQRRITVVR